MPQERKVGSWPGTTVLFRLGTCSAARTSAGERPERHLGAVPVLPHARLGLDVPIETKPHAPNLRPEWIGRPGLVQRLTRTAVRLMLADAAVSDVTLTEPAQADLAERTEGLASRGVFGGTLAAQSPLTA